MKAIIKSKTLWLNAIAAILMMLALPQFVSLIPEVALPYIGLATAVLNGILRLFFTAQPLTEMAAGGDNS